MAIIEANQLTKVFRINQKEPGLWGAIRGLFDPRHTDKVAVDHIHFCVDPGEVVGYIGVNGAGKSTTIKMLTGILQPSEGTVRVLGRDPHRQRVANARDIGVVFGQRTQLWWDLALIESLNMIAKIYELEPARYKTLLDRFSKDLELGELLKLPIRNMSLGQKMRAELAATLIHEPKIVYLDEPTIGLDLIVKERIREFIKEQNRERGTTVILTTHDLGDIEQLCKRVIIIDNGKIIYDGPLATIKDRFGKYRTITFETTVPVAAQAASLSLPAGAEIVSNGAEADERKLVLRFDRTVATASQVAASLMNQIEVKDFSLAEPDLSSIIKQIYNGALDEAIHQKDPDQALKQPGEEDGVLGKACQPERAEGQP
jgi:ABC-2 type transport system ATP-binding protein